MQVYSNPLFLSEQVQPATQLNKLSGVALVADSTAEGPAATAESTATPQTADCVAAAQSASRSDSEQASEETSGTDASSQLQSEQDAEETSADDAASQLQSKQDTEHASASQSASRLQDQQDAEYASASQSASQLRSEQDVEHASASQSASRLQEQQDSDLAAAASSASTTGRIEEVDFRVPVSYTPCSKVHIAACATSHGKPLLLCNNASGRHCAVAGLTDEVLVHFTATWAMHWMHFICLFVHMFMEYEVDQAMNTAIQPAVVACTK